MVVKIAQQAAHFVTVRMDSYAQCSLTNTHMMRTHS